MAMMTSTASNSPAEDLTSLSEVELSALRREAAAKLATLDEEVSRRRRLAEAEPAKVGGHTASEKCALSPWAASRYARQLVLPEFGPEAQAALAKASFLVVGCGGLGCPAALYLAAAGAGRLGLVDHDVVEENNLHRQVAHTEARCGTEKAASLAAAVRGVNSALLVTVRTLALDSTNAMPILADHDIVLDCTDNPATRYLLNDACVLAGKPLVSGSALRFEGQLTVYNFQKKGPTYRCLFPQPPPASAVTNCSEGGVLGPVPGVVGVLQALEAVKVATGVGEPLSGRLLLLDGLAGTTRVVKLRGRRPEADEVRELVDYAAFCGSAATDKDADRSLLPEAERVTAAGLAERLSQGDKPVLIDVRPKAETSICGLAGSINIPLGELDADSLKAAADQRGREVIFVCRRGNDSQLAVRKAAALGLDLSLKDLKGGLTAWASTVDPTLPIY